MISKLMLAVGLLVLYVFLMVRFIRRRRSATQKPMAMVPAYRVLQNLPPLNPLSPTPMVPVPASASTALVKREAQYEPVYVVPPGHSVISRPHTVFIAQQGAVVRAAIDSMAIVLQGAQGIAEPGSCILAEIGARVIPAGGRIEWMPAGSWNRQFQQPPN